MVHSEVQRDNPTNKKEFTIHYITVFFLLYFSITFSVTYTYFCCGNEQTGRIYFLSAASEQEVSFWLHHFNEWKQRSKSKKGTLTNSGSNSNLSINVNNNNNSIPTTSSSSSGSNINNTNRFHTTSPRSVTFSSSPPPGRGVCFSFPLSLSLLF